MHGDNSPTSTPAAGGGVVTVQFIDAFDALLEEYANRPVDPMAALQIAHTAALQYLAAREAETRQIATSAIVRIENLEAHQQPDPEYYSVMAWAKLTGVKVQLTEAATLGRKASFLSKHNGYESGKARDPRFGTVGLYHTDILTRVFQARNQGAKS